MSPMQQMLLGVGAVATKTYVDDVFSTFLYNGTGSAQSINNGIDLSSEGGMVWLKGRSSGKDHKLTDTVRGVNSQLMSQDDSAATTNTDLITSFNNNGFTMGSHAEINQSGVTQASWTFRKAPGFFTCLTFTGNSSTTQVISHDLGCIPGMILLKRTDTSGDWQVYHRGVNGGVNPEQYTLELNSTSAQQDYTEIWNDTAPTSTNFVAGEWNNVNNATYIVYLFAGGESTATTAASGDFDGSNDYLYLSGSTDLNLTGDFTIEFWVYPRSQSTSRQSIIQTGSWGSQYAVIQIQNDTQTGLDKKAQIWDYDMNQSMPIIYSNTDIEEDQWTHVAFTRSSGTIKIWINGILDKTATGLSDSIDLGHTTTLIGKHAGGTNYYLDAKLSNLRIVKGTAIYTSSFKPPTEPLANITNTKLLCLQNSSTVNAATVSPGTISKDGSPGPAASTDSPFDDPAAHVFGESGDQGIIKCGSYVGNGSSTGPEINLGFEPQWLLVKNASSGSTGWTILDSMRGIITGDNEYEIYANSNDAEINTNGNRMSLTPTGFKLKDTASYFNTSGDTYIFCAIRRPDGYVGKPRTATELFAMDTGNNSSTIPAFDSGFPVDFALMRQPATSESWYTGARLTGGKYLKTDSNSAQNNGTESNWVFDSNTGWIKSYSSSYQSWMWSRRGQGFDVVAYKGTSTSYPSGIFQSIPHSLGKTPEMILIKNRTAGNNWEVGHKGLDGGTNPWEHYIELNSSAAENGSLASGVNVIWGNGAPNATHFNVGDFGAVNSSSHDYIAMLFASVDGISKVGYYTGNGSTGQTITTGFAPRFVIIRRTNDDQYWTVLDTLRGWDGTNDPELYLNYSGAQNPASSCTPTSNGFTLSDSSANVNNTNDKYIYYAHA